MAIVRGMSNKSFRCIVSRRLYTIGTSVLHFKQLIVPIKNAHKKSVEPWVLIGTFEVFDYLYTPITTYKSTPNVKAVAWVWSVV